MLPGPLIFCNPSSHPTKMYIQRIKYLIIYIGCIFLLLYRQYILAKKLRRLIQGGKNLIYSLKRGKLKSLLRALRKFKERILKTGKN